MIHSELLVIPTLLLVFLALTLLLIVRLRQRQKKQQPGHDAACLSTTDDRLLVAFASQSGFAESLAWKTAKALSRKGVAVKIEELANLDARTIGRFKKALFVVSTTGKGDPPDRARNFAQKVMRATPAFQGLQYAVLALGDRHYDNFCAFGHKLDNWLKNCGATAFQELIAVDNADDYSLQKWKNSVVGETQPEDPRNVPEHGYFRWRITGRTLLNKGSTGNPVYYISLAPVDPPPVWQAGDIAVVFPGPANKAFSADANLKAREYSVASIPADGHLALVVRRHYGPANHIGLGSGWLTEKVQPGQSVALSIRTNRAFHAPVDGRPMILIGSGTGIAGLRAHLKARAASGMHRNWLIFGERCAAYDWLFKSEIDDWHKEGHIQRLDIAFSQDQHEKFYVQHVVTDAAGAISEWIGNRGAIYVCGSAIGMGEEVHNALSHILGADTMEQLASAGRYCRDVY